MLLTSLGNSTLTGDSRVSRYTSHVCSTCGLKVLMVSGHQREAARYSSPLLRVLSRKGLALPFFWGSASLTMLCSLLGIELCPSYLS